MDPDTELIQDDNPPDILPGFPLLIGPDEHKNAIVTTFKGVGEPLAQSAAPVSDNDSEDDLFQTQHELLPVRTLKRHQQNADPVSQGDTFQSSTDDEESRSPENCNGVSETQDEVGSKSTTNPKTSKAYCWKAQPFPFLKDIYKRDLPYSRKTQQQEYGAIAGFFTYVKKMKRNLKSGEESSSRLRKQRFLDEDEELVPISDPDESEGSDITEDSDDVKVVELSHFILKYPKRFRGYNHWTEQSSGLTGKDGNVYSSDRGTESKYKGGNCEQIHQLADIHVQGVSKLLHSGMTIEAGEQTGARRTRNSIATRVHASEPLPCLSRFPVMARKTGEMARKTREIPLKEQQQGTIITQPKKRKTSDDKGRHATGLSVICDTETPNDVQIDSCEWVEDTAPSGVPQTEAPAGLSITRETRKSKRSKTQEASRKKVTRSKVGQLKDLAVEKADPPEISLWLKQNINEHEEIVGLGDFVDEDFVAEIDSSVFEMSHSGAVGVLDDQGHKEGKTMQHNQVVPSEKSPTEKMPGGRTKNLSGSKCEKSGNDRSEDELSLLLYSEDEIDVQDNRRAIDLHDRNHDRK